jgi:hypothetical protein
MISVTGPPARMEIVSIGRLSGNCGDIAKDMEALWFRTDGHSASFPDIATQ